MSSWLAVLALVLPSCLAQIHFPGETHLKNVRQLTFENINSEAYFSFDDRYLTLQVTGYGVDCDQIYRMDLSQPNQTLHRISTGIGTATCSFFFPNNRDILYSGNFHKTKINARKLTDDNSCTPKKCSSPEAEKDPILREQCEKSYVWDMYPTYDIFKVNEYGNIIAQLTDNDAYDAEAVISPDGKNILYTSKENGDLDIYIMDIDGTNKKQLTHELGYDGGGFFSPDSKKIVYRASRPKTDEEIATYKYLLERDLIAPNEMELYVMNVDGSGKRPVFKTPLGQISWAPYYHPDNKRIIFSSNFNSTGPDDPDFNLYIVNEDGTGLEQVTFDGSHFDGFPMFSRDGKKLVWSSGRGSASSHSQNVFIADWVDPGTSASDVSNDELERGGSKEELRTNRIPKKADQEKLMRWQDTNTAPYDDVIHFEGERHFRNVKQLTFGGQNAEGYFSYDDSKLTLQATGYGTACDQIYELDLNKDPRDQIMRRISTGLGTTTCSFFYKEPDNDRRLYAGNFWALNATTFKNVRNTCPAKKCANPATITDPVLKQLCNTSYTWDVFPDYDIFLVNKYGNIIKQLTDEHGYDAEAVLSPDGKTIAFTSIRSGDLELYTMNTDGTNVKQITHELGYDGGSFFSPDGKRLVFRASRPKTEEEIKKYKKLLEYNLVEPVLMELYVVDVDGSNMRQITNLSVASWAPYYLADNKRIVFSSNYNASDNGFGAFALFVINDDGTGLERITFGNEYQFNSFPMMNHAGTKLVWGSSRNGSSMFDLNLFLADWTDDVNASVYASFSLLLVPLLMLNLL